MTENLSGNDDMSRQYNIISAQGSALIRKFYMCTESANVLHYIHAYCGVAIEQSHLENCVSHSIMCLDCYAMNVGRDCSAIYMFVSRGNVKY